MLRARSPSALEAAWKGPPCPWDVNSVPRPEAPVVQGGGEDEGFCRAGIGHSATPTPEFKLETTSPLLGRQKYPTGHTQRAPRAAGFAYGRALWGSPAAGPNTDLQPLHSPHLEQLLAATQKKSLKNPIPCLFNYLDRLCEAVWWHHWPMMWSPTAPTPVCHIPPSPGLCSWRVLCLIQGICPCNKERASQICFPNFASFFCSPKQWADNRLSIWCKISRSFVLLCSARVTDMNCV